MNRVINKQLGCRLSGLHISLSETLFPLKISTRRATKLILHTALLIVHRSRYCKLTTYAWLPQCTSLHVTTLCNQHAMPSIATCGQQFIRSAIIQQLAGKKFHYVIILIASLFSWLENRTGVKMRHTSCALNLSNLIAITLTYRLTRVF